MQYRPKSLLRFSVTSYGKTQMNFWPTQHNITHMLCNITYDKQAENKELGQKSQSYFRSLILEL